MSGSKRVDPEESRPALELVVIFGLVWYCGADGADGGKLDVNMSGILSAMPLRAS